jgi:chaperonin GroEL
VEAGVVPGGGAALLACAARLDELHLPTDESAGVRILGKALAEPMRAIVDNAGHDSAGILHQARCRGPGWMFDVVAQDWVPASHGGPSDPLVVTQAALEAGVSAAVVALSADVLVSRKSHA